LLLEGCTQKDAAPALAVGMPVPDLPLKAFDGEHSYLSAYQGRLLVLNVWAPWCEPCLDEMPSLDRLSQRLDQDRFAVIGLTVDEDRFLAEEFLRKNAISFSNYLDEQRHIVEEVLGVTSFPQTFLISPQRRLLARVTGWQAWDTPEVVEALEQRYRTETQIKRSADTEGGSS
jgi:thiol-disulfide isomerase/thioredoxin